MATTKKSPSRDFNPRSPCGERRFHPVIRGYLNYISIHAPRVGSDFTKNSCESCRAKFQSTLPVWGATLGMEMGIELLKISIHAPRVGSDIVEVWL